MKPTIVASDRIAVIVNSANPIKGLTKKQVEQIFSGDVTDWSGVGGSGGKISVYTRNTSSGTYSEFKELAMKKRDYAGSSQKMAGNEQIAAEVGKNPSGVGYVGMAYTKASGVKAMPVDGAVPTTKSVQAHTYPYRRTNLLHKRATPVAWPRSLSTEWVPVARKSWRKLDLYRSNESVVVRLTEARGDKCSGGLFLSRSFAISETKKTTAKETAAGSLSRHDANR